MRIKYHYKRTTLPKSPSYPKCVWFIVDGGYVCVGIVSFIQDIPQSGPITNF